MTNYPLWVMRLLFAAVAANVIALAVATVGRNPQVVTAGTVAVLLGLLCWYLAVPAGDDRRVRRTVGILGLLIGCLSLVGRRLLQAIL